MTQRGLCCRKMFFRFLADRTNGRDYATVLRLSSSLSVVCNVCIVAKVRYVLPKKCPKKQIGNDLCGIEWSRDRWCHVTSKGQDHDTTMLRA